jgi:hypothetical protein
VIPGLAQTPAYALAILRGNTEAADARIERQAILTMDDGKTPVMFFSALQEGRWPPGQA